MVEEILFHIKENWELFRNFWWAYLLVFMICISTIYAAYVIKKQTPKQLESKGSVSNRFEDPLYYFIGVIVGIFGMAFEHIEPVQRYVESNRHVHIVFYWLYSLGGEIAVWLFWIALTLFCFVLGIKKYQEKGKCSFNKNQ